MARRGDDDTSPEAIGSRLELTRVAMRMAQNDFCGKAGIAPNTYNQYERGKKRPSLENALKLAQTYGLTLDWIYLGDPSGLRYELADAIKALSVLKKSH